MSAPLCGDPKATEVILLGGCVAAEEDPTKQLILRLTTTDPDVERWWKAIEAAGGLGNARDSAVTLMHRWKLRLMDDLPETWGNERSRARSDNSGDSGPRQSTRESSK